MIIQTNLMFQNTVTSSHCFQCITAEAKHQDKHLPFAWHIRIKPEMILMRLMNGVPQYIGTWLVYG